MSVPFILAVVALGGVVWSASCGQMNGEKWKVRVFWPPQPTTNQTLPLSILFRIRVTSTISRHALLLISNQLYYRLWCYMSRSSSDRLSQDMSELGPTSSRRPARELRARCCCLVGAGAAGTVVSPDVSRSRVPVRDEVVVRGY